jgi:hypothetical protein
LPAGIFALSHGGFRPVGAGSASARCFWPFLMAKKPASVRYFMPLFTIGMPRNFCSFSLIRSREGLRIRTRIFA